MSPKPERVEFPQRRAFTALCLFVTLLTELACSSGSPKVTANTASPWPAGVVLPKPPADIPEPVRGELVTLAQDVANALCGRAASCCTSLDARLASNCVTYASVVWAAADVAKVHASPDATFEYTFDETHAAACREQLAQLESGCGFELAR